METIEELAIEKKNEMDLGNGLLSSSIVVVFL